MRRTPLKRSHRGWPPGRSARQVARADKWAAVKRARAESVNFICEGQILGICAERGVHAHHVIRDRSINTFDNCRWLCLPCHTWVHANPEKATGRGLLASKFCPQESAGTASPQSKTRTPTGADDLLGASSYTVVCDFCEWWGYVEIDGGFVCPECQKWNKVEYLP